MSRIAALKYGLSHVLRPVALLLILFAFHSLSELAFAQCQVEARSSFNGVLAVHIDAYSRPDEAVVNELKQFADSNRIRIESNPSRASNEFLQSRISYSTARYDSLYSGYVIVDSVVDNTESGFFKNMKDVQHILYRKYNFGIEAGRYACAAENDPTLDVEERWMITYSPSMILLQFQYLLDNYHTNKIQFEKAIEGPLYQFYGPVWIQDCSVVSDTVWEESGTAMRRLRLDAHGIYDGKALNVSYDIAVDVVLSDDTVQSVYYTIGIGSMSRSAHSLISQSMGFRGFGRASFEIVRGHLNTQHSGEKHHE